MPHVSNDSRSAFARICFADALFSSASAVVLIAASGPIASLLGPSVPQWLVAAIGICLIPWALLHFHLARRSVFSPELARTSMIGDAAWVIVSIAVMIFDAHLLSGMGLVAIGAVALEVAGIGIAKYISTRKVETRFAGAH